ncbi:hypothetical protein L210DRAFT_2355 [Boletus edulis BED1]|uniref:DRBM domain-containing protein n=1 Tax=Boletus edulis BED1 TaxID=1328754 RepID=A0AAD4GAS9_BOLED|nr:hypothetical protein L210DRAFT_2355 [Boletus edulis BED1]
MQGQQSRTDWRMYLNNFLQGRYGHTRQLSWVHTQSGPSHDTRWLAIAYFNGIEYGRGVARDRGTAMEIAAETTYRALTSYYN